MSMILKVLISSKKTVVNFGFNIGFMFNLIVNAIELQFVARNWEDTCSGLIFYEVYKT